MFFCPFELHSLQNVWGAHGQNRGGIRRTVSTRTVNEQQHVHTLNYNVGVVFDDPLTLHAAPPRTSPYRTTQKHVGYGVTNDMYPSVGTALITTLEQGLGDQFTQLTKEAWTWVFGIISGVCM